MRTNLEQYLALTVQMLIAREEGRPEDPYLDELDRVGDFLTDEESAFLNEMGKDRADLIGKSKGSYLQSVLNKIHDLAGQMGDIHPNVGAIQAWIHEVSPCKTCEHDWKDARNQIVQSGEVCLKCGALRPGNRNDEGNPWAPNKDYPEKPMIEPRSAIEMHDQQCHCTCSYCTKGERDV